MATESEAEGDRRLAERRQIAAFGRGVCESSSTYILVFHANTMRSSSMPMSRKERSLTATAFSRASESRRAQPLVPARYRPAGGITGIRSVRFEQFP